MRIKTKNQMKKYILFIIILFGVLTSNAQKTNCECIVHDAKKVKADSIYTFSNGKSIAICGYREGNPNIFSEFYLNRCDMDSSLGFWDALRDCKVTLENDTLIIREFKLIANSPNQDLIVNVWTIEKFYFEGNKLKMKTLINPDIKLYTKTETNKILERYELAKGELDEDKMLLANQLFVAMISGSNDAFKYFKNFEKKFSLADGYFKEELDDLENMYLVWLKYKLSK